MKPREIYNRTARIYKSRHTSPATRYHRKFERFLIKRYARGRILDAGCGTGYWLGPNTVGLDVSEGMLRQSEGMRVQGNAETLPFTDSSFDTVLSMFGVLNFIGPDKFSRETFRVLKPGGRLIMSVASRKENRKFRVGGTRVKLNLLDKDDVLGVFSDAGFTLDYFDGIFIFEQPVWGCWEPISVWGKLKLKLERALGKKQNGRIHLYVFSKPDKK